MDFPSSARTRSRRAIGAIAVVLAGLVGSWRRLICALRARRAGDRSSCSSCPSSRRDVPAGSRGSLLAVIGVAGSRPRPWRCSLDPRISSGFGRVRHARPLLPARARRGRVMAWAGWQELQAEGGKFQLGEPRRRPRRPPPVLRPDDRPASPPAAAAARRHRAGTPASSDRLLRSSHRAPTSHRAAPPSLSRTTARPPDQRLRQQLGRPAAEGARSRRLRRRAHPPAARSRRRPRARRRWRPPPRPRPTRPRRRPRRSATCRTSAPMSPWVAASSSGGSSSDLLEIGERQRHQVVGRGGPSAAAPPSLPDHERVAVIERRREPDPRPVRARAVRRRRPPPSTAGHLAPAPAATPLPGWRAAPRCAGSARRRRSGCGPAGSRAAPCARSGARWRASPRAG